MTLQPGFLAPAGDIAQTLDAAVAHHGGPEAIKATVGAILVGIPAAWREEVTPPLDGFWRRLGFQGPIIDYRRQLGEFGSASAVAAVMALALLEHGAVPGPLAGGTEWPLAGRGILLLGMGATLSTMVAVRS